MTPAAKAAAFLHLLADEAAAAERKAGVSVERWYRVAGLCVRLHVAGAQLVPFLTRAIAHLEIAPQGTPDLVLRAWDCAALGVEYPTAPVDMDAFTPRGEVRGFDDSRYLIAFAQMGRLLSAMDRDRGEAYYCVADATAIPRFEAAEPLRAIFAWLTRDHGRQVVHAGAVGTPEGGVLLLGRSGAGKSNTSLACLDSALSYASDDFCAVSLDAQPRVFSLYSTGKTIHRDWARHPFFARLSADVDPTGQEKVIYYLHEAVPEKLIESFPLRAIVAVRRGGEKVGTRPISSGAALALAAPDTAMLIPGAGIEVLRGLGRLVRTVPCHELLLGPDPAAVAPALVAFVGQLNAQARAPA